MLEIVNQLDGFDSRGNIKVLMATNRPDTLDPALLRPGRLDRKVGGLRRAVPSGCLTCACIACYVVLCWLCAGLGGFWCNVQLRAAQVVHAGNAMHHAEQHAVEQQADGGARVTRSTAILNLIPHHTPYGS